MNYLNFDLLIERAGRRYKALVLDSPAGQAAVEFKSPFSEIELENFLLKLNLPRRGSRRVDSPEMKAAKNFGRHLFETVFDGEVRGCFRSSLDEAVRLDSGLRLCLRLANTPELADLPWEYLYNASLWAIWSAKDWCGRTDPFSGTAQSLVQQGIPAVIAMQFAVTDKAAITFAHEFYAAIAEGNAIDAALSETRKAILVEGNEIEWAAPVLYMRSPDGRIFDIAPSDKIAPMPTMDEPFVRLYNSHVRLSLLFYLAGLSKEQQGPSITEICQTLAIKKRKDAVAALQELAADRLIEQTRKGKNVNWCISEKGQEVLQKLGELIKTRMATLGR